MIYEKRNLKDFILVHHWLYPWYWLWQKFRDAGNKPVIVCSFRQNLFKVHETWWKFFQKFLVEKYTKWYSNAREHYKYIEILLSDNSRLTHPPMKLHWYRPKVISETIKRGVAANPGFMGAWAENHHLIICPDLIAALNQNFKLKLTRSDLHVTNLAI